jgi:myo-inositol 2-dehydrogenase / D-chiro-inositol 1-dehydrogenase
LAEQIRYGLIGTGMMGVEHIKNLAITPGALITALADPVSTSLGWAQSALNDCRGFGAESKTATVFADAKALADSGLVDAVVVASPNHTHRQVLEPLFDAGLHILCEKPLATTLDDARWVVDRAQETPGIFWTAMEYRYMPPVTEFIAQIHAKRIGKLQMLSIREHRFPFLEKVGDWNRFSENTGGTMVEKCCHFFDLMRLMIQSEPVRVYCSGAMDINHVEEVYDGRIPDIIDNSYTTVDFANGVRAMLDLSMFADGAENQEEMAAVGDKARLECLIPTGDIIYSPRTGYHNPKIPERTHVPVDEAALRAGSHHGATWFEHQKFAAAIRDGGPVEVSAEDGLIAVAMGRAAEISAREKRVIDMQELGF